MKLYLRHWTGTAMGVVIALATTSCYYDPNYMVGGSYGAEYGEGHGYGGSGFSTSLFISTGDPRWGYDPYCYSYYDYHRRCYYDPYLHGYYPMGYRPVVVVGVPHPYGYNRSYCPPPARVSYITLSNYQNREHAYRNSNYSWAPQVRPYHGSPNRQADNQHAAPYSRSQPPSPQPAYPNSGHAGYSSNRGQAPAPMNPSGMSGGSTPNEGWRNRTNPSRPVPAGSYSAPPRPSPQVNPSQPAHTRAPYAAQPQAAPRVETSRPMPESRREPAAMPTSPQGAGGRATAPPAGAPHHAKPDRGEGKDENRGRSR